MFSCWAKKCFTTWGLFISVMSHVKLIAETRVHVWHKNMKSMGFLKLFAEKHIKIYHKKWRRIQYETATITSYYVLWVFHKLTCRQCKCTPKNGTILLFIFNSIRYGNFPYATILKQLLSNSSGVPQSILIINSYLMTVVKVIFRHKLDQYIDTQSFFVLSLTLHDWWIWNYLKQLESLLLQLVPGWPTFSTEWLDYRSKTRPKSFSGRTHDQYHSFSQVEQTTPKCSSDWKIQLNHDIVLFCIIRTHPHQFAHPFFPSPQTC